MTTVNNVFEFLNKIAPVEMKMDFDNVGFLVGRADAEVRKILVALDITNDVITESAELNAQLVVSHHPLFFSLKSVTDADNTGSKIVRLLTGGQSAICMHTNLDAARGGVNDVLAKAAGIADKADAGLLNEDGRTSAGEAYSIGRVGFLESPCSMADYLLKLKRNLGTKGLRYYDAGREVYKVAVVGGSGGDAFEHALRHGCDTFVTSDIKYHLFLEAKEVEINLIDGGHFCTENLVMPVLAQKLREAFPEVETTTAKSHAQPPIEFY
ncbi:MAG: Nif3-like dinuclear metal center hexameric protein [Oscillospiraceae bacterium]|nr:Nif3-like dinuclear metal center hexameric protein [Oscillospiraceae bacterium]